MTARILNPAMLTEMCKMRASPSTMGGNMPCSRQLNRIKRDLFGAVNPSDISRKFNEELEKHQDLAMKKWGFDFRSGLPLLNSSQFVWERVSYNDFVPEMYTLSHAAHVRPIINDATSFDTLMDERAERENLTNTLSSSIVETDDSCDDSQDETMTFKVPSVVRHKTAQPTLTLSCRKSLGKRQPKITEYMKERKRLSQTPKKTSPSKRMRTSSGSSSNTHIFLPRKC